MKRREFIKHVATGAVSASSLAACMSSSKPDGSNQPNIVWIMLDDCRADAFGCYGSKWAKTPNIDRIANAGTMFRNTIVQSPVCVPSRRSMKTGRYVHEVGPMAMGPEPTTPLNYFDKEKVERLERSRILIDSWTDANVNVVNVGKAHAFEDRFLQIGDEAPLLDHLGRPTEILKQLYPDDFESLIRRSVKTDTYGWQIGGLLDVDPKDTETWRLGDLAMQTLGVVSKEEAPFFLRVSFHAPHVACYVPPAYMIDPRSIELPLPSTKELATKPNVEQNALKTYSGASLDREQIDFCRGTYYGMVSLVDVQIGRLVEKLKKLHVLENTIIAICSDQGFQLGEHGFWKKRAFYECNVRAPLIFSGKGVPKGKVVDSQVEMIDFLPTLQDFSGVSLNSDVAGKSLAGLAANPALSAREYCFAEIDHSMSVYSELRQSSGRRIMIRSDEWKLEATFNQLLPAHDGSLYHLASDPREESNLFDVAKYRGVRTRLESVVMDWASTDSK